MEKITYRNNSAGKMMSKEKMRPTKWS